MADFVGVLEEAADRVTVALDALLPRSDGPESRVMEAMRYAALGPGKRIRPFLAIECGRLVNAEERSLLRCAAALEELQRTRSAAALRSYVAVVREHFAREEAWFQETNSGGYADFVRGVRCRAIRMGREPY